MARTSRARVDPVLGRCASAPGSLSTRLARAARRLPSRRPRPDAGQRSATVPPTTDTALTPPAALPESAHPSPCATGNPDVVPRPQPRRPRSEICLDESASRTWPAAPPESAATSTSTPPQFGCCDDRLNSPSRYGTTKAMSCQVGAASARDRRPLLSELTLIAYVWALAR